MCVIGWQAGAYSKNLPLCWISNLAVDAQNKKAVYFFEVNQGKRPYLTIRKPIQSNFTWCTNKRTPDQTRRTSPIEAMPWLWRDLWCQLGPYTGQISIRAGYPRSLNPKTPKPHDVQCDINVNEYISIVYSAINNEYRMFRIQFEPCSGLLSAPILVWRRQTANF